MKKKKDNMIYLQHKLPWETEWIDVDSEKNENVDLFVMSLKDEPTYLVEIEYRIIAKKNIKLRNKEKYVICPECIMSGLEIATRIKNIRKSNE